jgi:hypothetical protein
MLRVAESAPRSDAYDICTTVILPGTVAMELPDSTTEPVCENYIFANYFR